jgi:hypothetical protein
MQTVSALVALILGVALLTWLSRSKKGKKAGSNVTVIDDTITVEIPQEAPVQTEPQEEPVHPSEPLPLVAEEPVKVLEEPQEVKKTAKKAATKKSTAKSKAKIKP